MRFLTTAAHRLLLLLLFLIPTAAMLAQDPLTITTTSGALSLQYPDGWQAEEFQEQIYLTNSPAGIDGLDATNLPPATIMVVVGAMDFTAIDGLSTDATFDDVLAYIEGTIEAENAEAAITLSVSEEVTIQGWRAHRYIGEQAGQELYLLVIEVDGSVLGLQALTLAGEMTQFVPTLETIADSIVYNPPPDVVVTGRVIWQQTAGLDFEGGNLTELSDLTVGPDDTLYIADENSGIAVFDAAGNFLRLMFGGELGTAQDVVYAPDGTLYAVGGTQVVYHLDTEGNVLGTWGEAGSEPHQFGEASPFEIEIIPDGGIGNIVTLDNQNAEDGSTVMRVQIWDGEGQLLSHFVPVNEDGSPVAFGFATLAVGPDESIYLAEFGEIYRYSIDGILMEGHIGAAVLSETSVSDLEIGPDGSLLVATYDGIIYQLDATGEYVRQFGGPQTDPDPEIDEPIPFVAGEFSAPEGVALLSNGDVVVSDTNFDYWQVVRFTFEGE